MKPSLQARSASRNPHYGTSIGAICDRRIPAFPATATVLAAARSMHSFGDRLAIVTDERAGRCVAVGVVTEHELLGVLVHGEDPAQLTVRETMRRDPAFVGEGDDVLEALCWMRRNGLHEVVVHGSAGTVVGTVTLDRLADSVAGELGEVAAHMPDESGAADRRARH
jgi:signal-transduction protein with cAMP-binding, CBS, and nucleotidyltransferase domain